MALFQPTNIIPSSFTVGVVNIYDKAEISWQLNGNSDMIGFKIEFFQNDENSTPIPSATVNVTLSTPFPPTDRFGQPQRYTWSTEKPWITYAAPAFVAGKQYKYKITQFYAQADQVEQVAQIEFNVFEPQIEATVTLYLADSTFQPIKELYSISEIDSSICYFTAQYLTISKAPIRSVRWQVAHRTGEQSGEQEIIYDTGEVYTSVLEFEYNGFFNGQTYGVRCIVEDENGLQAYVSSAGYYGWHFFTKRDTAQRFGGEFTMEYLPKENATLLKWSDNNIPGIIHGRYNLIHDDNSDAYGVFLQKSNIESGLPNLEWNPNEPFMEPWTASFSLGGEQLGEDFSDAVRATAHTSTFEAKGLIYDVHTYNAKTGQPYPLTTQISANRKSCTVTFPSNSSPSRPEPAVPIRIHLDESLYAPTGTLAKIVMHNGSVTISAELIPTTHRYRVYVNDTIIWSTNLPSVDGTAPTSSAFNVAITDTKAIVYNSGKKVNETDIQYTQSEIESVQIFSGDDGIAVYCVSVFRGILSDSLLDSFGTNINNKPFFANTPDYVPYMIAHLEGNFDAGHISSYRLYRQEIGTNLLVPILYSKNGQYYQAKDYSIVSRKTYTYWLYEYDDNDSYLSGKQCTIQDSDETASVTTCFNNYSLLVCDYDSETDTYHVRKEYLFALNLSEGTIGNNNTPTLNANFTPYPTRMPSTQNYTNGTLQGLIGAIYTVPALLEQISGYKHFEKPSTLDYFDSVDLEKELYDLSIAPYQLFLRDMKGHLRMISTSAPITMSQDLKKKQLPSTISLPWVEIGDASDVVIIQTPDDYGWNDDEQILDVRLDADPTTGVLSANYPRPYNGTTFYLTGAHKEVLGAQTPSGVTPAQFRLSDTATETDDGTLLAIATVNDEKGD